MEPRTKARTAGPRAAEERPELPPLDPEEVARRAYGLYEARGRTPGHEHEDWLEAERQLHAERQGRTAAPAGKGKAAGARDAKPVRARDGKPGRPSEAEA